MTQSTSPSPVQVPKAAGISGPLKLLLLSIAGIAFLVIGMTCGFYLRKLPQESAKVAEVTANSHSHNDAPETKEVVELPEVDHNDGHGESPAVVEHGNPAESATDQPTPLMDALLHEAVLPDAPSERQPDHRLASGDKFLLMGSYRQALEIYTSLATSDPAFQPAEVRLRMALCDEALGNYQRSQSNYRKVVELMPAMEYREEAILGQARLWCLAGRSELAAISLFRALLTSAGNGANATTSQIPHELAGMLAQRVHSEGMDDVPAAEACYLDQHLMAPKLNVEPYQVIARLMNRELTPAPSDVSTVNDISIVERFGDAPDEIYVNVRAARMTVLELVRRVSNRTGWKVRITEECRLRLLEHTVQPDCLNLPLALVLDAILEPFEAIWRTEDGAILILLSKSAGTKELNGYRLQSAQRSLRFASTRAAEHPWAAASALELGRLAAASGNLDQAAQYIRKMLDQFPRSEFLAVAWFNLGKIELLRGRLEDALIAFYHASDLLSGHSMEALSYLYAGRIQLECDRPRDAISPLTRALVLANGSPFEGMATLQLASAYLLLDHFKRANEILLEHRKPLMTDNIQDQAAFLSELIRYRGTKDELDRMRSASSLVAAMTNLKPSRCFGGHWFLLAALTYRDFGMAQQEIALLRSCLKNSYAYPLQSRARQQLLEDAPELLSELQPQLIPEVRRGRPAPIFFQTQLKEAATAFNQGNYEQALNMSRELAQHEQIPDEDRRAALRLMGRIHQARGEHELAVQCFSGIVPKASQKVRPETAALPFPVRGVQ